MDLQLKDINSHCYINEINAHNSIMSVICTIIDDCTSNFAFFLGILGYSNIISINFPIWEG